MLQEHSCYSGQEVHPLWQRQWHFVSVPPALPQRKNSLGQTARMPLALTCRAAQLCFLQCTACITITATHHDHVFSITCVLVKRVLPSFTAQNIFVYKTQSMTAMQRIAHLSGLATKLLLALLACLLAMPQSHNASHKAIQGTEGAH